MNVLVSMVSVWYQKLNFTTKTREVILNKQINILRYAFEISKNEIKITSNKALYGGRIPQFLKFLENFWLLRTDLYIPIFNPYQKKKTLRKVMQYFSIANKTTENFFKKSINSINDHKKVLNVWHVL